MLSWTCMAVIALAVVFTLGVAIHVMEWMERRRYRTAFMLDNRGPAERKRWMVSWAWLRW